MVSAVTPVERAAPLRDQVATTLERMIVEGDLAPGERLIEVELAALLGVSRNPIREALPVLSRSGWVIGPSRQGTFVRTHELADALDTFHVRELLEAEAARLAAAHATAVDLAELRAMLGRADDLVERSDRQGLVAANSMFHARLAAASGNRTLTELIDAIDKRVRWYFGRVAVGRAASSWADHATLVAAIEARDPDAAERAMRSHVGGTVAAFRALWDSQHPRPAQP